MSKKIKMKIYGDEKTYSLTLPETFDSLKKKFKILFKLNDEEMKTLEIYYWDPDAKPPKDDEDSSQLLEMEKDEDYSDFLAEKNISHSFIRIKYKKDENKSKTSAKPQMMLSRMNLDKSNENYNSNQQITDMDIRHSAKNRSMNNSNFNDMIITHSFIINKESSIEIPKESQDNLKDNLKLNTIDKKSSGVIEKEVLFDIKKVLSEFEERLNKTFNETKAEIVNNIKELIISQQALNNTLIESHNSQLEIITSQKEATKTQFEMINTQKESRETQLEIINTMKETIASQSSMMNSFNETIKSQLEILSSFKRDITSQPANSIKMEPICDKNHSSSNTSEKQIDTVEKNDSSKKQIAKGIPAEENMDGFVKLEGKKVMNNKDEIVNPLLNSEAKSSVYLIDDEEENKNDEKREIKSITIQNNVEPNIIVNNNDQQNNTNNINKFGELENNKPNSSNEDGSNNINAQSIRRIDSIYEDMLLQFIEMYGPDLVEGFNEGKKLEIMEQCGGDFEKAYNIFAELIN